MSLIVNKAEHTYTLDGQRLPSVTDVLGLLHNFDSIPWAVLENARQRGERVHAAINAYNRGVEDVADELARPFVQQWAQFLEDTGAVVIQSEQPLYHKTLRYAGTPDCVLSWKGDRLLLPDVKATWEVPPTVGAQTAAYAEAYKSLQTRRVRLDRACVHLTADSYKLHPRNDSADWSLFVSTLNVYRFLEKAA
jgi:hypothetical protein